MAYDDFDIELARERGAPDPEGNARRANEILAFSAQKRFGEASSALESITDPVIRKDLEQIITLYSTCNCFPQG